MIERHPIASYAHGCYVTSMSKKGKGKSRLAHIKPMTVPRLELSAAVLAVQLDETLKSELEIPLHQSVFWTDSTTVLQYIRNESARFQTFVSNRLTQQFMNIPNLANGDT